MQVDTEKVEGALRRRRSNLAIRVMHWWRRGAHGLWLGLALRWCNSWLSRGDPMFPPIRALDLVLDEESLHNSGNVFLRLRIRNYWIRWWTSITIWVLTWNLCASLSCWWQWHVGEEGFVVIRQRRWTNDSGTILVIDGGEDECCSLARLICDGVNEGSHGNLRQLCDWWSDQWMIEERLGFLEVEEVEDDDVLKVVTWFSLMFNS